MTVVRVSAPGKVNLFFRVGALGLDGFHDVASIYQAVNVREAVSVESAEEWSIRVSGDISERQLASVPTGSDNLVVRAADAISKVSKLENTKPLKFEITKRVPVAGGMGGGSADAAAALVAIDRLWQTGLNNDELHAAAASLGADVPFALMGGTALGTGRGEILEAIENVGSFNWVLVSNANGLSTPSVYKRLDEIRILLGQDPAKISKPEIPPAMLTALSSGDANLLAPFLHNDLQVAAIDLLPELQQTLDEGLAAGAIAAMVSGSGPTVALLVTDAVTAIRVSNQLQAKGYSALATMGPVIGTQIEDN